MFFLFQPAAESHTVSDQESSKKSLSKNNNGVKIDTEKWRKNETESEREEKSTTKSAFTPVKPIPTYKTLSNLSTLTPTPTLNQEKTSLTLPIVSPKIDVQVHHPPKKQQKKQHQEKFIGQNVLNEEVSSKRTIPNVYTEADDVRKKNKRCKKLQYFFVQFFKFF